MNWILGLPELVLALSGLAILLVGVLQNRDTTLLCTMLCIAALVVVGALVLQTPYGVGYGGLFVSDRFATFAKILVLFGAGFAMILGLDYNDKQRIARFEFPVLMLFSTVGMMVMVSAASLMSLYMGLELQSLAIYVLCAFARDDVRSSEAGLKYFVLSALASGLLLYGISLAYGFSGSMDFAIWRPRSPTLPASPPGSSSASCSSSPGSPSSSPPCRSTCGRRTSMRARPRR